MLQSPHDHKRALPVTESRAGGLHAETRGRISHEETRALAGDLGMTADDLLRRRQGQALNAEQALAARQLVSKSGNELVNLAKRVKGGSDEDLAAFRQAWVRHVARSEEHTSELQSLMRISYAVFCLKKKKKNNNYRH